MHDDTTPRIESYWWINGVGLWLSAVIAAHSIHAYWAAGMTMFAFLCVSAQLTAIACAILARRAMTADMPAAGAVAALAAMGCAYWAAKGLAFAWDQSGQPVFTPAVWFICALEPGLFLLAEHVRAGRIERARQAAERLAEEAAILGHRQPFRPTLVEPSATQPADRPGRPAASATQPATLAGLAAVVAASATQPAMSATQPADLAEPSATPAVSASQHEPAGRVPGAHRPGIDRDDDERHALRLLAEGRLSARRIAAATGLSRYRVSQLAEEVSGSARLAG